MATRVSVSMVPSGAATPTGAQSQPGAHQLVPDGMSPNGKRPRSDQSAATGRSPLGPSETSTAVLEIQPLLRSAAEAVQWNCDLLNAVIGRVNSLEAWTKVAESQVTASTEFVAQHSEKLSELTGFGDQLKSAFSAREGVPGRCSTPLGDRAGDQGDRPGCRYPEEADRRP